MDKPSQHFRNTVSKLRSNIREGALEGLSVVSQRVVDQTPVDTAASKGNWQAVKKLEQTKPFSPTKTAPTVYKDLSNIMEVRDVEGKKGAPALQELYLVNPTPYALDWELGRYPRESAKVTADGFSRQAPDGVVTVFEKQDSITLANAVKQVLEKF
jgi:hypothetical protein